VEYAATLAREIQKERGLSIAALSGENSPFFRKTLLQQRKETDEAYGKFSRFLWKQEQWKGEKSIKGFLSLYAEISEYRRKVDDRALPAMEIFHFYSKLVDRLLETTEALGEKFINDTFARTIKNFENLLYLIEISGKERALISALLESGHGDPHIENQLLGLENDYEELLRRFRQNATVHTLQIYHRHLTPQLEKEYRSTRRQIIFARQYNLVDSRKWWELSTRYINSLYRIDFALLQHLNELKESQKSEAIRTLWISVLLWLLFLGFLYGLLLYILGILEGFGRTIERREEETRLYKALAEFSEYLVFHRNEVILLNSLNTLLYQTGRFRYLWIGRFEGEEAVPLYSENISIASVEEELHSIPGGEERFVHALEQIRREKHPIHFSTEHLESVLFEQVEEVGLFPILRSRECAYVLVVTLPAGVTFDTTLLDLIQKMCNSLSGTLELIEVEEQERRLEEELRVAATAFNAHEAITITDSDGTILQVNDAFTQITGYTAEEAIGNNPNILKSGKHDKEFYVRMWDSIRKEGFWKGEIYNRRKNGEIYPEMLSISAVKDQEGKITHYVAHFFDITEIKNAQHDAEYRAQHDALTDLYNRQKLTDELERVYRQAVRTREYSAFLYLDVDNFKHINDYYNHEMGDKVLMEISRRLEQVVHGEDLLARFAGDEFALILCCLGTDRRMATKKITIVVEKIRNLFREPLRIDDDVTFEITFSIGIKLFPDAEKEWKEVMINADVAMYHAKKSGKNRYNFFDENLDMESKRFLKLKNEFSRAIRERELVIYYQPRLEVTGGKTVGMEALVRWQHPERGLIYPDEFLFVAQGNTLGYELDEYVLREVCRQIEEWRSRYPGFDLKVSVNISGEQFNSRNHIENTLEYLRRKREIAPLLEFEIVEDALLKDLDHTIGVIRRFKELGVSFGMDDFGTGYSSIEYLKRLPVDVVKIDRSFIMDLFENRNDEVVKLIVKTAEIFGMETVAEGVENLRALEYLQSIGCTYYQGYYFSPPVPPEKMEKFFRT
jgi:diguanylate cyclase (GGDEF)-like protein/PAS domain S-box-containing protein